MPLSENDKEFGNSVAVIGGGIAGITAAVKLFQQGYHVTLFEKADVLGGNLSSNSKSNRGDLDDVYPHIFGDWYNEFWYLLENDFGLNRKDLFLRRDDVRMALVPAAKELSGFDDVEFATIATPTTLSNLLTNCYSGVLSPRDMLLFGYTYLDLVSVPSTDKRRSKLLSDLDVTGYLYSRPYMNDKIAAFHDDILKVIWSMPSEETSAKAYQKLLRHTLTFPHETPFAWLIRGPLRTTLIEPITLQLEAAFKANVGNSIRLRSEILGIAVNRNGDQDHSVTLTIKGRRVPETFRYAVVATPPRTAGRLALGDGGMNSLVKRLPRLARLREARGGRIPVVYLYFNEEFLLRHADDLKKLPDELTGFKRLEASPEEAKVLNSLPSLGENYDISIHNIASVWSPAVLNAKPGEPVLVLAASRAEGIKAIGTEEDPKDCGEAQGFAMISKLHGYLPFIEPGDRWGIGGSIDWNRTRVISNAKHLLFLNNTGSNKWRPSARLEDDKGRLVSTNVFFAGDYCLTDVDMATVEAATQSGVLAAQALHVQATGRPTPILMQPHTVYSSQALLFVKLLLTPAACVAALDAAFEEARESPIEAVTFPCTALVMTTSYWTDWLRSALQLGRHLLPGSDELNPDATGASGGHDRKIGILGLAANVAWALVLEGPVVGPQLREGAADALYKAWHRSFGQVLFPGLRDTLRDPVKARPASAGPSQLGRDRSWSGILRQTLGRDDPTAEDVSDPAVASAAAALHFIGRVLEADRDGRAPGLEGQRRASLDHGLRGHRKRTRRYRDYDVVHTLRGPAQPQPAAPTSA